LDNPAGEAMAMRAEALVAQALHKHTVLPALLLATPPE